MIKLSDIALRRGKYLLFEQVNLDIHDGEKIGLIGDNGSGKTSLLRAMLGEIGADVGDLIIPADMRISHVAQETPDTQQSALDYVLDGDAGFRQVESAINALHGRHDVASAALFEQMEIIDGYGAPARAAKLLSGLGFKTSTQSHSTNSFSGGWRVRLNLARALMSPSDLLLLDEPTNHLDLDAIVWLEEWLKKYLGTLLMISHDRDFIDGCCKRMLHIENRQIRSYTGNYSQFEKQRAERLSLERSMFEKQARKISHMESYISRFKYQASKAKQAQSRIKALEKMQRIVPAHVGSPFSFEFKPCNRLSDPILKLENVKAGYGDSVILNDVNLDIAGGDRIGLLGANGAGKSTLVKTMATELAVISGNLLATKHLNIGYFAQHQMEQLDPKRTPMQHFNRLYPDMTTQEIRNYLGGFDFKGERVDEPVAPFSGGEKARLALALIIVDSPNLLLLDEPTNHLDMEMRHSLSLAMQSFEGAIILVSHDRSLIDAVTDKLLLVREGSARWFDDDLAGYLRILRQSNADSAAPAATTDAKMSKKQLRQITAKRREQMKPQRQKVHDLDKEIQRQQSKINTLTITLNAADSYDTISTAKLAIMMREKTALENRLVSLETGWLEASEQLERLQQSLDSITA